MQHPKPLTQLAYLDTRESGSSFTGQCTESKTFGSIIPMEKVANIASEVFWKIFFQSGQNRELILLCERR